MELGLIQGGHLLDVLLARLGIAHGAVVGGVQSIAVGHAQVDIAALGHGHILVGTGSGLDQYIQFARVGNGVADGGAHIIEGAGGGGSAQGQVAAYAVGIHLTGGLGGSLGGRGHGGRFTGAAACQNGGQGGQGKDHSNNFFHDNSPSLCIENCF